MTIKKNNTFQIFEYFDDEVRVSTKFFEQMYPDGRPYKYYETMIFNGEYDCYQERCDTYNEALEQHKKAATLIKNMMNHIPEF